MDTAAPGMERGDSGKPRLLYSSHFSVVDADSDLSAPLNDLNINPKLKINDKKEAAFRDSLFFRFA